jgi:hypothetical protein
MSRVGLVVLAFIGAGCCHRYKCGVPPTILTVHDENGHRLLDATVTGIPAQLVDPCGATDSCSFQILGTGQFTVGAPGRKSIGVSFNPRNDDCGNAMGQAVDVTLVPESLDSPATMRVTATAGCGG